MYTNSASNATPQWSPLARATPNEECFYEYKEKENEENEYRGFNRGRFYDVVPLDSCSVGVDDKIVVKFDFKNKKVTATEYEEPMEVVNVNWERVTEFFRKIQE